MPTSSPSARTFDRPAYRNNIILESRSSLPGRQSQSDSVKRLDVKFPGFAMARVEPRFRRGDEITAAVKRVRPGGWPRRDDLFLAHFHHESTLVLPRVTPATLPRLDHEQRPVEYFRFRC